MRGTFLPARNCISERVDKFLVKIIITFIQHLVKSHLFIATNLFHVDLCPKSSGIQNRVRLNETFSFPYQKEKREKTAASQVLINSLLALCRQLE